MSEPRQRLGLKSAVEAMPPEELEWFDHGLRIMISDGPPASVAFLERMLGDVIVPASIGMPIRDAGGMASTLDRIPNGEFLSLALLFSEMAGNRPEASAEFLRSIGLEFGASMERQRQSIPPNPDREAFVEAISGFFVEVDE